jgi:hypothetical protein
MLFVRRNAFEVEGEEYVFIRSYRVGHTLETDLLFVVVYTQTKGGCHLINDSGKIAGDGFGKWYGVLCPADAKDRLVSDLEAEEHPYVQDEACSFRPIPTLHRKR